MNTRNLCRVVLSVLGLSVSFYGISTPDIVIAGLGGFSFAIAIAASKGKEE